jgi:hypothetical protein
MVLSYEPPNVLLQRETAIGVPAFVFDRRSIWPTLQPPDAQYHVRAADGAACAAQRRSRSVHLDALHRYEQCALDKAYLARSKSESSHYKRASSKHN